MPAGTPLPGRTSPQSRQRRVHSAHHKPPVTISTNAYVGIAGTRPTAPGSPATQLAQFAIASMPQPMIVNGHASIPSGIKTSADMRRLEAAGVKGVLVGESLMRAPDIGPALDALLDGTRGTPAASVRHAQH